MIGLYATIQKSPIVDTSVIRQGIADIEKNIRLYGPNIPEGLLKGTVHDVLKESARITYRDMYSEAMSNLNTDKKSSINPFKDSKKNTDNIKEVINRQREQKAYAEKLQNKSIETNKPQSSFGEIFKLEREKQGIGGLFEYEGKKYTTNYDWES